MVVWEMLVLLEGELTVKDRLPKQGNLLKGIDKKNVKRHGISRYALHLFSFLSNAQFFKEKMVPNCKKIINEVNCLIKKLILISQVPLF